MSVRIVVGSQVIEFPSSGQDANWAPAVIQFAQAAADQLAAIASQFDISPRVQILTSNANTNLDVNGVIFPSGSVRSFAFSYAIYRVSDTPFSLAEDGMVSGVYDTLNSTWNLQHEFEGSRQADGTPYHTFTMSGDQLQITTVAISGAYDNVNSKLSYAAKTVLTSDI
jgi:hypothetical protein